MTFGSHPNCIKILVQENSNKFDRKMLLEARYIIDAELAAMTREHIIFQKQILAQRLGIHRNRIPHLLKMVGLKDLT